MSIYTQDTPPEPGTNQRRMPNFLVVISVIVLMFVVYEWYRNYSSTRIVETALEDMTITHKGAWESRNVEALADCNQFNGTLIVSCIGAFEQGHGDNQAVILILRIFTFVPGNSPAALEEQLDGMLDSMDFSPTDQESLLVDGREALRVRFRHDLSLSRGQIVLVKPSLYAYFFMALTSSGSQQFLTLDAQIDEFMGGVHFTAANAESTEEPAEEATAEVTETAK